MKKFLVLLFSVFMLVGCGSKEEPNPTPVHEHTYATTYSHDDDYHWFAATCEHTMLVKDKAEHEFEDNKCKVCGFEKGPSQPEYVHNEHSINNITAAGTYSNIYGEVVAVNTKGLIIADQEATTYAYGVTGFEVGDYISISGPVVDYQGVKEFSGDVTATKLDASLKPTYTPTNKTLDAATMTALKATTTFTLDPVVYTWTAVVGKSGNYLTFDVSGFAEPIEAPYLPATYSFTEGQSYTLKAYYYGFNTKSNYANFMLISAVASDTPVTPNHKCEHKCPVCGKCLDATCTDPVCSSKCSCAVDYPNTIFFVFNSKDPVPSYGIAGGNEGQKAEEQTFTYKDVTYGYKYGDQHITSSGNYLFLKNTDDGGCLYNTTAFAKSIKSIKVELTTSASKNSDIYLTLGTSKMDSVLTSTVTLHGKDAPLIIEAGDGEFTYFNLSSGTAANSQIAKITIELK